mmetsp:Transcript_132701/g.383661  ORF Transcript_132701/g.383661 Transcript_132701/m.383661 type:complete len:206 (-) Transcript_132701:558-1175(-)
MPRPLLHEAEGIGADMCVGLGLHPSQALPELRSPREPPRELRPGRQPHSELHDIGAGLGLGAELQCQGPSALKALALALCSLSGGGLLARLALLLGALLGFRPLTGEDLHREVRVEEREVRLGLQLPDHELVRVAVVPDWKPIALSQRCVAPQALLQDVLQVHVHNAGAAGMEALASWLELDPTLRAPREPEVSHLHLPDGREGV